MLKGVGADTFLSDAGEVCTVQGRQILLVDIHDAGSRGLRRNDFKACVGHLPCHTLSDLGEFSVICLFRSPEGLTWCPRGIYNHSQRMYQELLLKVLIQPKKFSTGQGLVMEPFNQCHTLGVSHPSCLSGVGELSLTHRF